LVGCREIGRPARSTGDLLNTSRAGIVRSRREAIMDAMTGAETISALTLV
jgi:hypothetical protein